LSFTTGSNPVLTTKEETKDVNYVITDLVSNHHLKEYVFSGTKGMAGDGL
jgi:hypothetical protein